MSSIAHSVLLFLVTASVCAAAPLYNVLQYGAVGDSQTDDTNAFLKAWGAACADQGSPTLFIPPKKTFLLSPIVFQGPCKSSIVIKLDGGLTAPNKIWTNELSHWILVSNVNGLTITGQGQIDGQGSIWWDCMAKKQCKQAPNSLGILACQDVEISGLSFVNSPGKHFTVHQSVRVRISFLKITAPEDSPNTDGMFIQESNGVEVTDSEIATGDDCIAVGTGSWGVNITRITCGPGHGISIGSLGGSKSTANVENIRVSDCSFFKTFYAARIKTWQGGSGFARKISFERINFNSVRLPILIDQYYCGSGSNCPNSTSAVQVSDISFVDARGTGSGEVAISLACSETVACTGIVLRDVSIKPVTGLDKQSSYCLNAHGRKAGELGPEVSCLSWTK